MYYKGEGVQQGLYSSTSLVYKAAMQGSANAQGILGMMYYEGERVQKDYIQAYKWALIARDNKLQELNDDNLKFIKFLLTTLESEMTENQMAEARSWPTNLQSNNNIIFRREPLMIFGFIA